MASTEVAVADFNDPHDLKDVGPARLTQSPASEVSVRSNTELLHELQISQIELEAQNRFLREAQAKLEALIDAIPDLLFEVGLDGQIYDYRGPRVDLLAAPASAFLGKNFSEVLPPDAAQTCLSAIGEASDKGWSVGKQYALLLPQGQRWFELSVALKSDTANQAKRFIVLARDITERKQMQDQLHQQAFNDHLTKLPNRLLLNDRLSQSIAASKRSRCYGALMFLDLDNFKPLNDTHGHAAGDFLLVEVASRLTGVVRETDTVARLGGDEFVVLLGELLADEDKSTGLASVVAEKIRLALAEPYQLSVTQPGDPVTSVEHHCSASIGVVLFVNHLSSQTDLMKWADAAMYQAKDAGRNTIRFYEKKTPPTLVYTA
jgi:diguanylate cyclase (GGDEF)-like protein/PAS domain S-box-containing protein